MVTLDAEMSVIGSILIDPRCAGLVCQMLSPEDFQPGVYRNLFIAAQRRHFENKPIDPVTLLHDTDPAYADTISEIMRLTPTAANADVYAELVREHSRLRRLQAIGQELAWARDYETGLKILAEAEALLTLSPSRRAVSYSEMISHYLDRQSSKEKPNYIDWGIKPLNRLKVSQGQFVVIAADSSVGKTAFALQLALNVARSGKRTCFFSYETSEEDASDRIIANATGVNLGKSKNRALSDNDIKKVYEEASDAESVPLKMIESGDYDIDSLRAETLAGRYEVIFIDYLQLIPTAARQLRADEVADISRKLRVMAQKLGVTIVALSQVTLPEKDRKGSRRRITMDDVAESKQIKKDAGVIIIIDYENPLDRLGPRLVRVDKNKEGPLGEFTMGFDYDHMRFYYLPPKPKAEDAVD